MEYTFGQTQVYTGWYMPSIHKVGFVCNSRYVNASAKIKKTRYIFCQLGDLLQKAKGFTKKGNGVVDIVWSESVHVYLRLKREQNGALLECNQRPHGAHFQRGH